MMKWIDLHVGLATEGLYRCLSVWGWEKFFDFFGWDGGYVSSWIVVVPLFTHPCIILVSNTLLALD